MTAKRKRLTKELDPNDEDADEEAKKPKKRGKTEAKPAPKEKAQQKKADDNKEDEDEDNDDSEEKKGKKSSKSKATSKPAKGKKSKGKEDDDEGDEEEGATSSSSTTSAVTETGPAYGPDPEHFKIISWNVNSIRACQKNDEAFTKYVKHEQPDVICIQETKVNDSTIPKNIAPGYKEFWYSGEKAGYAGTAIFSKTDPVSVTNGFGIKEHDAEGRTITIEFDTFYLVNTYVPNSGNKLDRLPYRTKNWDAALLAHLKKLEEKKPIIWTGDLNVAHNEIDLAKPDSNHKTAGFTNEERANFTKLLGAGFVDTFRHLYPKEKKYSFWSYKRQSRQSNIGWRLDYFVVSQSLLPRVSNSFIRSSVVGSDHCPIGILLTKK